MQLKIVVTQFWRDLKAHRLRTGLTLFGLGWGTFCVIVLLSFGEGLQRKQHETAGAIGQRIILIWGSRTSLPFEGLPRGRRIMLEETDIDALLRQVPSLSNASAEYSMGTSLKGPAGQAPANISGVRPSFGGMRNLTPDPDGRFLNDLDQADRRRVAVIGSQVKQDLFGSAPAIGRTVEIAGVPFLIVGTLPKKEQDSNYNGRDDGKVFIPASTIRASLGQQWPGNLVVELREGAKGKEVMQEIRAVLGRIHHFDAGDEEALMSWDIGEMLAMIGTIFMGFKVFLTILGSLTLAVAGIGVANIMSMVVEDRTSQIGISMALGARRSWVLGQILLETLLVTAVGGGLGVLLAAGVITGAQHIPMGNLGSPVLSWQIALLTAALLGFIGIVAGMGPARRAALLSPAAALRT